MPGPPTTANATPQAFDAPLLSPDDTVRILARHDALSERRRFDAGYQQGHSEGFAQGVAEAAGAIEDHRRSAERLTSLGSALEQAIRSLEAADDGDMAMVEDGVVELAMQVAEAVIGREVTDHAFVVENVRRTMQLRGRDGSVQLRVHPDDLASLDEARAASLVTLPADAVVVADASVTRGGCVLDTGDARIDAQIDAAVGRIRDALTTG